MSASQKPVCCVKGCPSLKDKVRQEALFVFPSNICPRGKRWLEMYPHSFSREPNQDNYICGRHFTPESFNRTGGLYHKADPSVNIDTSYSQDIMMKKFLMKAVYEWALRNSVDFHSNLIKDKAAEVKFFLGMPTNVDQWLWTSKFLKFTTGVNGFRFGSGQKGPKHILNVIKDIRQQLPSNISLPADMYTSVEEDDPVQVKDEEVNDEPADEPFQDKDVVPHKSLDTYQEALELLTPLKDYIIRIGNENASSRIREIETIVKQVIKNESNPKRVSKRRR